MDGTRVARIASAVSTLLLIPLRMTHSPFTAWACVLVSALLFVVLLSLRLSRFWQSRSRTTGRLVVRLFLRCLATAGPATLISLAFATPHDTRHHGLLLCASVMFMLAGLAFLVQMVFDCWKLALVGLAPGHPEEHRR